MPCPGSVSSSSLEVRYASKKKTPQRRVAFVRGRNSSSSDDAATKAEAQQVSCSGHGTCAVGRCFCAAGWSGEGCEVHVGCPEHCGERAGRGICVENEWCVREVCFLLSPMLLCSALLLVSHTHRRTFLSAAPASARLASRVKGAPRASRGRLLLLLLLLLRASAPCDREE